MGFSGMNALQFNFAQVPLLDRKKRVPLLFCHGESDVYIPHKLALWTYQPLINEGF